MKLVYFNDYRLGVVDGDNVVDVTEAVPGITPGDSRGLIERFGELRSAIEQAAASGSAVPLDSVTLQAPVPRPTSIVCMAVNYRDSSGENKPPVNAFLKSPTAILNPGGTMILPDIPATIFEGEAEFALIISKRADNVPASEAMDYIFGYTNFIDGSARGMGPAAGQGASGGNTFYQVKSRKTFAPIGPYLVTADEIADPHDLQIRLWNNGELMQDYHSSGMWTDIPNVIEFISSIHPLEAGDIVALGTHHDGLHPFQDGDVIEVETTGLGRLTVNVQDDLKRTWERETRMDRIQSGQKGATPQTSGKYAEATGATA